MRCTKCGKEFKVLIPHNTKMKLEWSDIEYLCKRCHDEQHSISIDLNSIHEKAKELLETIGIDIHNENFVRTPERFTSWLIEYAKTDYIKVVEECAASTFTIDSSVMVVQKGIKSFTLCPHHLLPVKLDVSVAYIAYRHVVGLSKIKRIVDAVSKQLTLQERLTSEIGKAIAFAARTSDVMVVVKANHMCMEFRGVKQKVDVVTNYISGEFRKQEVKQEAMEVMKQ